MKNNALFNVFVLFFFTLFLNIGIGYAGEKTKENKVKNYDKLKNKKLRKLKEKKEQDQILKKEIIGYVRKHKKREAGEGWLYLANYYVELDDLDRALVYLKRIIRSSQVKKSIKWEARMLRSEVYNKRKKYHLAIEDLEDLIKDKPDRKIFVRAKIKRAEIFSRDLTSIKNVYDAFYRYYSTFPEKNDIEASEYMMGFQRGYNLEIGMRALEAWEEISKFPEVSAANLAYLHIALMYGMDLSKREKAYEFISKIKKNKNDEAVIDGKFLEAVLFQLSNNQKKLIDASKLYSEFRNKTESLTGYRISCILQSQLFLNKLNKPEEAIKVLESLFEIPPHLVASESISIEKRKEKAEKTIDWAILACKMAGYICEYKIDNPDRARYYYSKGLDFNKKREVEQDEFWLKAGIDRTEPKISPAQMLFDLAFEKYRSQKLKQAVKYYEQFIKKYPNHPLHREALYRVAVITDDDMRNYPEALKKYRRYLINFVPRKSTWNLDVLYDWGRIDEVRYRIGTLLALHLKDPVQALDVFKELVSDYPDSYWAKQGFKDSIRIYRDDLGDLNTANEMMLKFISKYPESSEAGIYRLKLYKIYLQQGEQIKALRMLRSYLDHRLPSKKDYFKLKKEWRDLAFKVREATLRKSMAASGKRDRIDTYQNLVDVLSLATSSAPLESLADEIETLKIPDELRWSLEYKVGVKLYLRYPQKAKEMFEKLEKSASGSAKLACILTLGNIAYRVDKNVDKAVKWYKKAIDMSGLTDSYIEIPTYRLGRLYLVQGKGILGLETLKNFVSRFPQSRYIAKAYMTMGEAYAVLHHPKQAIMFYRKAMNLSEKLSEDAGKAISKLMSAETTEEWLERRETNLKETSDKNKKENERRKKQVARIKIANSEKKVENQSLEKLSNDDIYEMVLSEYLKAKPSYELTSKYLFEILKRDKVNSELRQKAVRHYISDRFFKDRKPDEFVENVQKLLSEFNYANWQSELLYRMAQAEDYFQKDYEAANKSYFEYLSFYPDGKRFLSIRKRIPVVYANNDDTKNAYRFYKKLISDSSISDSDRTDASIELAQLQFENDEKDDAIKTLEASLVFDSKRKSEICLKLERLTSNFNYVEKALEFDGDEESKFKALKRVIKKAEEDKKFDKAEELLNKYSKHFKLPQSTVWIAKKREDLNKRGVIKSIQNKIDQYPEEPETPDRMFRLAKLVEGTENTEYRSQDLFYEITLVYPNSQYFRESKIRADNSRAISAVSELSDMLKKGTKGAESEEIIIERARLLKDDLKDLKGALENYESFLKLFPDSERLDEVYLNMGDLILAEEKDSDKAVKTWEKGMAVSRDPFTREALTKRINGLREFRSKILYSENKVKQEEAFNQIYKVWRLDNDKSYALGLVRDALAKLKNRPNVARLRYVAGRILEESNKLNDAYNEYDKALRCIYHPGCRKDMLFYRMARIKVKEHKEKEAFALYRAMVQRYPKSLLSRSAFYWLYKYENKKENYTKAHYYLERLLEFKSIYPTQREELYKIEKEVEAKMNIEEMEKLKKYSSRGGGDLPYFIGKVLEYDLQDYDKAISQYQEFLKSSPPTRQSREVLKKIVNLYEKKGDYVSAVGYLDKLLGTYEPAEENLNLIIRIGIMVEDKLGSPELAKLFYRSIASDYYKIPKVRRFALAKLRVIEEKKREAAVKPKTHRKIKRVYSDEDNEIIEELKDIIERQVDDLQDFKKAERKMEDLWDENSGSIATLDIMKALVDLNMKHLMDPQKASMYYEKWLAENPDDPLASQYTMKLYDFYTEKLRDGDKALHLLENYIKSHPTSADTIGMELKLGKLNEQLLKNYDEAQRIYQRIIDTKQNDPIVHEAYFRMGFVLRDGFAYYDQAIKNWQELIDLFYNNEYADKAQFAIAFTYETYLRDYTKARENYEKILNLYPNSQFQNQTRDALIRIEGKN